MRSHHQWAFILPILLFLPLGGFNPVRQDTGQADFNINVMPAGQGWDVYITYHIKGVLLPEVAYKGGVTPVVAKLPAPYIDGYSFNKDNLRCGGSIDPITGQYQYPNRGTGLWATIFPRELTGGAELIHGTFGDCSEDGPTTIHPDPLIEPQDYPDIAGSIWQRIELPVLEIKANPRLGLVTVPAWFWLQQIQNGEWWPGTDPAQGGRLFGVVVTIPTPRETYTVQVLAEAAWLKWDFADGSDSAIKFTRLVGKAYPLTSNIKHPYAGVGTFFPEVLIHYIPRYSTGADWTILPDKYRESFWQSQGYRVREAQTILIDPVLVPCEGNHYGSDCGPGF